MQITFPLAWTNTCCSHPLSAADELGDIRVAARRKMRHEVGLDVPLHELRYVTRVAYRARCAPPAEQWGEHEVSGGQLAPSDAQIDYCLLNVANDRACVPNANEVAAVRYVTVDELKAMIDESQRPNTSVHFSPWFRLIAGRFLFEWWQHLDDTAAITDRDNIHNLIE